MELDRQRIRKQLETERERLERVRQDLLGDLETRGDSSSVGELSGYDQHPGDIGSEVFEHEKNYSVLEQVEAGITEVDEALRRLEAGTYGTCQACGRPIPPERLEALPATRFCVEDQARVEQRFRPAAGEV